MKCLYKHTYVKDLNILIYFSLATLSYAAVVDSHLARPSNC